MTTGDCVVVRIPSGDYTLALEGRLHGHVDGASQDFRKFYRRLGAVDPEAITDSSEKKKSRDANGMQGFWLLTHAGELTRLASPLKLLRGETSAEFPYYGTIPVASIQYVS